MKKVCFLLLIVLVASVFAGCGDTDKTPTHGAEVQVNFSDLE